MFALGMEKHRNCPPHIDYTKCAKRCHLEIFSKSTDPLGRKTIYPAVHGGRPARKTHPHRTQSVKKYQYLDEDPEDLISIGTIGLIKAVVTFNADKGNRLAAYASKCIENEILMYLRSKKKSKKEVSLYEPIGTDREGNEIKLYDIIETDEEDVSEKIYLRENIQKLYEKVESELSDRERLVLKMRYGLYSGEEYTQREIARQLGISRSYVSRIEKSAVEKLRKVF